VVSKSKALESAHLVIIS